jgi:hypothetical protein
MVEALAPAVALEADENLPEEDGRQLRRDVPILAQVWLHLPLVGSGTDRHYAPRTSRAKTLGSRRPLFAGAELLHLLPGHALSVIRGADFLYEPKDNGQDTFVLCEINFSCVWSFPPQGHKSAGGRRFACVRAARRAVRSWRRLQPVKRGSAGRECAASVPRLRYCEMRSACRGRRRSPPDTARRSD